MGEWVGIDRAPSRQWVPMARPWNGGAAEMAPCPAPAGAVGSQPSGPGLPCVGGTGAAQHLWVLSISACPGCCRVPGMPSLPARPDPAAPWATARSPLPGQRQRGGPGQPPGGEHSPRAGPQGWHRALVCLRGAARSCPWCETGGNKEHCLEALPSPSFLPCRGAGPCPGVAKGCFWCHHLPAPQLPHKAPQGQPPHPCQWPRSPQLCRPARGKGQRQQPHFPAPLVV